MFPLPSDLCQPRTLSSLHRQVFYVIVYEMFQRPDSEGNFLSGPLYKLPHPSEVLCMTFSSLYTRKVEQKGKQEAQAA